MSKNEFLKTGNRDIGLDITRIIAFLLVPSVHFFPYAGLYDTPVIGIRMSIAIMLQTLCTINVPLFMLLTGYLMSVKQIPIERSSIKKFYKGLSTIVITYILACVIIFFFRLFIQHDNLMLRDLILSCLRYDGYAWYVKMYIGLYFLIPFLNILWQSAGRKESQLILLVVLLFLTAAPSVFNIWNFHIPGALFRPWITDTYDKLVPDWWKDLYPITYYYLGAYVRRNVDLKKLHSGKLLFFLLVSLLLSGLFNVWRSYSVCFIGGNWCEYSGVQNVINSILLFLFINSFHYRPLPTWGLKRLVLISNLTFGAYLLSWIPDQIIYPVLNAAVKDVPDRIFNFPIYIGKTVLISLLLSFLIFVLSSCLKTAIISLQKKRSH